jgi:hypothetical protein
MTDFTEELVHSDHRCVTSKIVWPFHKPAKRKLIPSIRTYVSATTAQLSQAQSEVQKGLERTPVNELSVSKEVLSIQKILKNVCDKVFVSKPLQIVRHLNKASSIIRKARRRGWEYHTWLSVVRKCRAKLKKLNKTSNAQIRHALDSVNTRPVQPVRAVKVNGRMINEPKAMQEVIGKQFERNRGCVPHIPVIDEHKQKGLPEEEKRSMLDLVTAEEVEFDLPNAKHKATDSSGITDKCIYMMAYKHKGCEALQLRLVGVLNRMMTMPHEDPAFIDKNQLDEVRELNRVLMTPIAKAKELKRFRPISIQGPVRKILSRIWLEPVKVEDIVSERQYAYTKLRTRDALVRKVMAVIERMLPVFFADKSGAYDSVDPGVLYIVLCRWFTEETAHAVASWSVFDQLECIYAAYAYIIM